MLKITFKEPQAIIQHGMLQVCLICFPVFVETTLDGKYTHLWFSYNQGDSDFVKTNTIESSTPINPNEL